MHSRGSVIAVFGVLWRNCDGGSPEDKCTVWVELDGTGVRCPLKEVNEDARCVKLRPLLLHLRVLCG